MSDWLLRGEQQTAGTELTEQAAGYNIIRLSHLGINKLPKPAVASLAELFGDVPELLGLILQTLQAKSASSAGEGIFLGDAAYPTTYKRS